jgi:hypothetical protein
MLARRTGEPVRDLSWMGWTVAADVSSDNRTVLFFDDGNTERTSGAWVRPLDGGDAVRLGDGEPGGFSADGHTAVGVSRPVGGPSQIVLMPVDTGQARKVTSLPAELSRPSFAGTTAVLFVRSQDSRSEVWRMALDGSDARSLGAQGCDLPSAEPSGRAFVCRGGETKAELSVFAMDGGPGRKLHALPENESFITVRWAADASRIFAVTNQGRFLKLDAATGRLLGQESLSPGVPSGSRPIFSASVSPDGQVQVYSVRRTTSGLYVLRGLR